MIQLPSEIQNSNWSISTNEFGGIVIGTDEINQTIGLILATRKGTDPFRPTFGSDIWDWIDSPIAVAGPNIVLAITEAVERWEPRVKIVSINYTTQNSFGETEGVVSGLVFSINWFLIGGTEQDLINLVIGVDSTAENIIFVLGTEDGTAIAFSDSTLIKFS